MAGSLHDFVQSSREKSRSSSSVTKLLSGSVESVWGAFSDKTGLVANTESEQVGATDAWFGKASTDPCLPTLTKKQRILGFMLFLLMGVFCFALSSLYIPLLILKARKFAVLYTLGSLFFIMSFAVLWGPWNHIKHLLTGPRLPFTAVYFMTIFATLYFAMWQRSYIFTIICAAVQILALVWYIVSYIPGGQTGLKFFSKVFYSVTAKTASSVLPV